MSNTTKYKDSLFVDLFCDDEKGKENFLSLYNAIHNTNLTLQNTTVEPMKLEKVLYQKFYNDVSMKVGDRIIVLCEHQSTVNYNMPLRCLIYVARLYEKMTDTRMRFARSLQKIAFPEFYVFYNGTDDIADEMELKLSDALKSQNESDKLILENLGIKDKDFPLELRVKVYNINKESVLKKLSACGILGEYEKFIDTVRKHKALGDDEYMKTAIRESIKSGVLKDYLKRKATEVENMLFAEYDYETDIAVQREEAMQLGEKQGEAKKAIESARIMIYDFGNPRDAVIEKLKLTPEQVAMLD